MNLVFLGPPGSGKGTQASMLAKSFGDKAIHLSTGELLRTEINKNSEIGLTVDEYMKAGKLVPDKDIFNIIEQNLSFYTEAEILIFDGFPRTLAQALRLEEIFLQKELKIDIVFNFLIDKNTLVKRVCGRFSCKNCGLGYNIYSNPTMIEGVCDSCGSGSFVKRLDDNETIFGDRLSVYEDLTFPLVDFYQKKGLLFSIKADIDPKAIFKEIHGVISDYKYKKRG